MGLVGHDYSFLIVSGAHTIKANQNKQNKNKTTKQEGEKTLSTQSKPQHMNLLPGGRVHKQAGGDLLVANTSHLWVSCSLLG